MLHTRNMLVGLVGAIAVGALSLAADVFPPARAQAVVDAQDPPSRVGRVAHLTGTVSFRSSDQAPWDTAALNYPVTSGNAFWTEPAAIAEIEIGSAHLALDQSSEFDIGTLDDQTLVATAVQGALYMRLGTLPPGDSYQIATPRGVVTIAKAGRYEIVAGDTDRPTQITVVEGSADIDIGSTSLTVTPRQTAQVTGTDSFRASIVQAANDPFLTARLASEKPPPVVAARSVAAPLIVAEMTGGDALINTGTWAPSPQYGRIWYPPVEADWVPYRHGHWGYVSPWGWTWIDDAPWGFAPFHYGRWVQDGRRWGWIPVQQGAVVAATVRPIYAPALVSFIGLAAGAAVRTQAMPDRGNSVGWIPLGPQEVYRPPYPVSTRYVREVNVTNVRNVTNITTTTQNVTINNYVNRQAVSVVPAAVMTASQPIAARVQPITPQAIALARPVQIAPVTPTTATIGVTPVVAKALNLKSEAGAPPTRPAAPGPAPEPSAGGVRIVPHIPVAASPGAAPPLAGRRPNIAAQPAAPGRQPAAIQPVTLPRLRPVPGGTSQPAAAGATQPVRPPSAETKPTTTPATAAPAKPELPAPVTTPPQTPELKQAPPPAPASATAPRAGTVAPVAAPTDAVPAKPGVPAPVTTPPQAPERKQAQPPAPASATAPRDGTPAPAAKPAAAVPAKPGAPAPVTTPPKTPEQKPAPPPTAGAATAPHPSTLAPAASPAAAVPAKPGAPAPITMPPETPEQKPAPPPTAGAATAPHPSTLAPAATPAAAVPAKPGVPAPPSASLQTFEQKPATPPVAPAGAASTPRFGTPAPAAVSAKPGTPAPATTPPQPPERKPTTPSAAGAANAPPAGTPAPTTVPAKLGAPDPVTPAPQTTGPKQQPATPPAAGAAIAPHAGAARPATEPPAPKPTAPPAPG